MKAIVFDQYGSLDDLQLRDVEKPTPKADEVLVRVYAASVNAADRYTVQGQPLPVRMETGLFRPNIRALGADLAGRVEAVGAAVTMFHPGDEVCADVSGCGFGAFAEYATVPERILARKPASITFEQAAALPMAAVTALQALRDKGRIQAGDSVLIHGASGGVGSFAVQIAKAFGAHVTAVCSPRKLDMVRSIGADDVIDYTTTDFTRSGQRYDLIVAANGYHPLRAYKQALKPGGRYVVSGGSMAQIFQGMLLGPLYAIGSDKQLGSLVAKPNAQDLELLAEWTATGRIKPVIDQCFPLAEAVAALRTLEAGLVNGKIVITVAQAG